MTMRSRLSPRFGKFREERFHLRGIARAAGYPRHSRLVAKTLHGAFDLPWQRILGAGGEIKLRGDYAIEQRFRLEAEGVTFRGRRVDMKRHEFQFEKMEKKKSSKGRTKS